MVGEIRDRETAEIAVQAALTGHLVLSTLHTRDAASALTRLIDMGIEPFMVASAIDCVVAQRLARTLCEHCKRAGGAVGLGARRARADGMLRCSSRPAASAAARPATTAGSGCTRSCRSTRRSARCCSITAASTRSRTAAAGTGMRTMREDGIEKVKLGLTSLAEIGRVTASVLTRPARGSRLRQ